jgi:hypothetical protein
MVCKEPTRSTARRNVGKDCFNKSKSKINKSKEFETSLKELTSKNSFK